MNANNLPAKVISTALLMGCALPLFSSSTYQLQRINPVQVFQRQAQTERSCPDCMGNSSKIVRHNGFLLGADFDYNFVDASMPDSIRSRGYFGFGISGGYQWFLAPHHLLSFVIGFHKNSNSTFTINNGQLSTTLNMLNAELQYHYQFSNGFSLGVLGGVSYVFGESEAKSLNMSGVTYKRIEPIAGVELGYYLTQEVKIGLVYRHYFGASQSHAYQSGYKSPSLDQISLGISYGF